MAITPIVVPAIGFTRFDGSNPNIAFDPTDTKVIQQFVELGDLEKLSNSNISAALRSAFASIIASFQTVQRLVEELSVLEAQKAILLLDPETPQADIDAIDGQIATTNAAIAAAKAVPDASLLLVQKLRAQLGSNKDQDFRSQLSWDALLTSALSAPGKSDEKQKERGEAQSVQDLGDLNYEKYQEILYDLVREVLASRELENDETVRLTPQQVRTVFFEFGIDPSDIDVGMQDPLAEDMLKPLTDSVALKALQQEISALKKDGLVPADGRTPQQTAPLTFAGEAPPKRLHEWGEAGFSAAVDPLELPAELEKLNDSELLTRHAFLSPLPRTIRALIEAKLAQANALKAQINERLGLELSFLTTDGSPHSPIVDPFAPLDADRSTPAEAEPLAAHDYGVNATQENPGAGSGTPSPDDQKELRLNADWIRIPI